MVLIKVDFPRPVCPVVVHVSNDGRIQWVVSELTNADDIELKATLQQLLFNLGGDAVEADVTFWVDGSLRVRRHDDGM
jgi:hypothetical protein